MYAFTKIRPFQKQCQSPLIQRAGIWYPRSFKHPLIQSSLFTGGQVAALYVLFHSQTGYLSKTKNILTNRFQLYKNKNIYLSLFFISIHCEHWVILILLASHFTCVMGVSRSDFVYHWFYILFWTFAVSFTKSHAIKKCTSKYVKIPWDPKTQEWSLCHNPYAYADCCLKCGGLSDGLSFCLCTRAVCQWVWIGDLDGNIPALRWLLQQAQQLADSRHTTFMKVDCCKTEHIRQSLFYLTSESTCGRVTSSINTTWTGCFIWRDAVFKAGCT